MPFSTLLKFVPLVPAGWKYFEKLTNWQGQKHDSAYQRLLEEVLLHYANLLALLVKKDDRTEDEIIAALAERLSEKSFERLQFSTLLQAVMAPSVGKMKMLSALAAHVHVSRWGPDMLGRIGACIVNITPAEALLLRCICMLNAEFYEPQEFIARGVPLADLKAYNFDLAERTRRVNSQLALLVEFEPNILVHRMELDNLQRMVLIQHKGAALERAKEIKIDPPPGEAGRFLSNLAPVQEPSMLAYSVSEAISSLEDEAFIDSDRGTGK